MDHSVDEARIPATVATTECLKHGKAPGTPCWEVPKIRKGEIVGHYAAICGSRARKAGFVGNVTSRSLSTSRASRTSSK